MGFLIDEKTFINDNIFKFEERMNSQYSRFLDKTPTFVTYYHINNIESITDNGFVNVERIIGEQSPLKFNMINDFPVYGLDSILLNLGDEEQGLDTNYDGELIILPNTVQPYANDFFTISYLNKGYLFMVTDVAYDTIKSNNYYKISFTVRSLDGIDVNDLTKQIDEKYNCILTNIGTQEKCLIKEDDYHLILKLNDIYKDIVNKYKLLFYNVKYNSFIFNDGGIKVYDKYLTHFINSNNLFNERFNYQTLFLTNEDQSTMFPLEYEKSFYRIIEKNKKSLVKPINYALLFIHYHTSIFNYYRDLSVRSVGFVEQNSSPYIDSDLIERIISDVKKEDENIIDSLLIDYFNDKITSIYGISTDKLEDYDYLDYSFRSFIMIPIILYIIRFYHNKFMAIN